MSLLTDTDIGNQVCTEKEWKDENKIYIFPFSDDSLTPTGYDVRVGSKYVSQIDADEIELGPDDGVVIRPTDTVLIETLEVVGMPKNKMISAFITSKVSNVSSGLSHVSTNIDPDWYGPLLIALQNASRSSVTLKRGERLCTLNFIENKSPSTKPSGHPSGRPDVLVKLFINTAKKNKLNKIRSARLLRTIKIVIVVLSAFTGYFLFQNAPGFIATTAAGIAISSNLPSIRRLPDEHKG